MVEDLSDKPKEQNNARSALEWVSYPASGLVGYAFGAPAVRKAAYDHLKQDGAFTDIQKTHYAERSKVIERILKGEKLDMLIESNALHTTYKERLAARFEELGLGTITQQWRYISGTQRQNALMTAFTAAGISIGVLLTIANSNVLEVISKKEDDKHER